MPHYWFDHSALVGGSETGQQRGIRGQVKALKSWVATPTTRNQLRRFAAANGFEFTAQTYDQLPGMIFRSAEREEVVRVSEMPEVEFGGCSSSGQNMPYFFGYVAVRHDLDLPRLILDSRANDGTAPKGSGIYARSDSHSSLTANFRGSDSATPMSRVRGQVDPLDLGAAVDARMRVFAGKQRVDDARRFLTGTTLAYFLDVTQYFDVEVVDGWVFLYAYGTEMCGTSPEGWAWNFSVASRLLDQIDDWSRVAPPRQGVAASEPAPRPSFYTQEEIAPPPAFVSGPVKASPGQEAFWDFLWRD